MLAAHDVSKSERRLRIGSHIPPPLEWMLGFLKGNVLKGIRDSLELSLYLWVD
jgi:hypothetical protein